MKKLLVLCGVVGFLGLYIYLGSVVIQVLEKRQRAHIEESSGWCEPRDDYLPGCQRR